MSVAVLKEKFAYDETSVFERYGQYELQQRLSRGGMAEIFLARELNPSGVARMVVIKRIRPSLATNKDVVALFKDEGDLGVRLQHPNIARVFTSSNDGATHYMVLEWLVGWTLREVLQKLMQQRRLLPIEVAVGLVRDACLGLAYAHGIKGHKGDSLGIVHRDISPHNLFVTIDGELKILDFGIAKSSAQMHQTFVGTIRGKPGYAAPEIFCGGDVDGRTDVFSLGVVLHELISGRPLFPQASFQRGRNHTAVLPPIRPGEQISNELAAAVMRALQKKPERRYEAIQFANALDSVLANLKTRYHRDATAIHMHHLLNEDEADRESGHGPQTAVGGQLYPTDGLKPHETKRIECGSAPEKSTPTKRVMSRGLGSTPEDSTRTKRVMSPRETETHHPVTATSLRSHEGTRSKGLAPTHLRSRLNLSLTWFWPTLVLGALGFIANILHAEAVPDVTQPGPIPTRTLRASTPPTGAPGDNTECETQIKPQANHSVRKPPASKPVVPARSRRTRKLRRQRTAAKKARPIAATGQLTLQTQPWVRVYHHEVDLGPTPLVKEKLPAGRVTLLLKNPEFDIAKRITIDVPAGRVLRKKLDLLN